MPKLQAYPSGIFKWENIWKYTGRVCSTYLAVVETCMKNLHLLLDLQLKVSIVRDTRGESSTLSIHISSYSGEILLVGWIIKNLN